MSEISENESKRIISEFKSRRIRQVFLAIPVVCVAIVYRYFLVNPEKVSEFLLGFNPVYTFIGVVFPFAVLTYLNWRCPKCNSYLGRSIFPTSCRRCGSELED